MYETFKSGLGILPGKPLVVMHWRRGANLTSVHCFDKESPADGLVKNINCARNVSEFISLVYSQTGTTQSTAKSEATSFIYISTDENSTETLNALNEAGFHTFGTALNSSLISAQINEVDQFVLELMLMCYADWYFGLIDSSITSLVLEKCDSPGKHRVVS